MVEIREGKATHDKNEVKLWPWRCAMEVETGKRHRKKVTKRRIGEN